MTLDQIHAPSPQFLCRCQVSTILSKLQPCNNLAGRGSCLD